ncbi:MAG: HAMP domain-containing protein, partial [Myxococcota bacterium]
MKVSQKLLLYALAVALLPLAATGFTLISRSESALRERVVLQQSTASHALAAQLNQSILTLADRLRTVLSLVDLAELSVDERKGVAVLLYRQSTAISVALLVDTSGAVLAPPVLLSAPQQAFDSLNHPIATEDDAIRVAKQFPDIPTETKVSAPYFDDDGRARVTLTVPTVLGQERVAAKVELILDTSMLNAPGIDPGASTSVFAVDARGVCMISDFHRPGTDLSSLAPVVAFAGGAGQDAVRYRDQGSAHVAAFAPVPVLGGALVVTQPEAVAFASVAAMRRQIFVWLILTLAVVLTTSLLFAGRLRAQLKVLIEGAQAFGRRNLDTPIALESQDELAELADTMNSMASDLAKSLFELEEWNTTLERRVAERTRELEKTQAQLLTQSKLAAIGQLGAGVA